MSFSSSKLLISLVLLMMKVSYAGTFTLQVKRPNHSILLRSKKAFLEFRPNASLHWGVKVSGDFFYIEYGGKIKDTNYGNSDVGNNSYQSYRLGIPLSNTYTEIGYQEWIGFSSDENSESGCDYCLERPNLSSRERNFHFTYATNKDFSMKGLSSNGSQGVKWSSSPLLKIFLNRLKFRDYGGLLQGNSSERFSFFADLISLEMRQAGLGIGYGLLAPFGPFYFGFSGILGAGYQENTREERDGSLKEEKGLGTHWSAKLMLASRNNTFNYGLKGFLFSNIYEVGDSNNAASLNYNVYVYTSLSW